MMFRKIVLSIMVVLILVGGIGTVLTIRVKSQVRELFRLNKYLQEQGYYMAEFEFHMVGFGYYLGKGKYLKALKGVSEYKAFLSDTANLIKIPEFKTNQEEIDFYLNLQNPNTGAFMDETVPFCAYLSNTENMLLHLEALLDSTTRPLQLKYPLRFLDEINTPEKLEAYLNDISYMNGLAASFPQTSFHFARDIINDARLDVVIERNNLYHFSPEWKYTLLKWMYDFQDEETGLWGPKHKRTKELLKNDVMNTYSILKIYRTSKGEDIYKDFPIKYTDRIFKSTIEQLKKPLPAEDDLSWIHEWNLQQAKGIKMLLACLWSDASDENKEEARKIIARFIEVSFDKYYVEKDGAFSYYPNSEYATVDGMNNMILKRIGALKYARQKRYWGEPEENANDLGVVEIDTLDDCNLKTLEDYPEINSWRLYTTQPDFRALQENVWALVYPKETKVLDVTELIPNIIQWAETSTLSTGNWKSMADIKKEYATFNSKKPMIYKQKFPYEEANKVLSNSSEMFVIGFDILQIPRFIMRLKKKGLQLNN